MAKSFGILALAQRNDRILRAAFAGVIVYVFTVVAVSPTLSEANTVVLGLRSSSGVADQVLTGYGVQAKSLRTTVESRLRAVVNKPAYAAYVREKNCLATAIYFEARSESVLGQKAVAEVVLARTREAGRPKTICGVVYEGSKRSTGCQFSFTCDGIADRVRDRNSWRQAMKIASNTMRTGGKVGAVVGNATYYHADYVNPAWASSMIKVAQIGTHIFYRAPGRSRRA